MMPPAIAPALEAFFELFEGKFEGKSVVEPPVVDDVLEGMWIEVFSMLSPHFSETDVQCFNGERFTLTTKAQIPRR